MDRGRASAPALIALAMVGALAACGSSASTATTKPVPRDTFSSQRYGFRVTLPGNWSEVDATVDWDGRELPGIDGAAWANFTDATTNRTLDVASARAGMGLAAWKAAMQAAEVPHTCLTSSSAARTSLGGEPALAWTAACRDGYHLDNLVALHGTHGYILFLASPTPGSTAADSRRIFESIRRSFGFTR
jgi:hypothetical protein